MTLYDLLIHPLVGQILGVAGLAYAFWCNRELARSKQHELLHLWTHLDRTRVSIWQNEAGQAALKVAIEEKPEDLTLHSALQLLEQAHINYCHDYTQTARHIVGRTHPFGIGTIEHWVEMERITSLWQLREFTSRLAEPSIWASRAAIRRVNERKSEIVESMRTRGDGSERGAHERTSNARLPTLFTQKRS